ncbi:MAG TPA: helix-hairpin-helix domain-containing protein, partial [Candidatus Xenobia bacterium]
RLLKPSITGEVDTARKAWADEEAIRTFAVNLRHLLLSSPAGEKAVLGIDPGFRTGCKIAVVDRTGRLLDHATVYPTEPRKDEAGAARTLLSLISKHGVQLIAIGNGTGGRETDAFVSKAIAGLPDRPVRVTVSEAGASVYSASPLAKAEFPDLDVTVRGAISIARRLQDPLAELVKLEPKSIGVGQYQHDVDQKALGRALEGVVESCVNHVGVDLNTASGALLQFVSGLSATQAKNIVAWRDAHGSFKSRAQLLDVPRFGPKAFEQAAGFLRLRQSSHPLDNSAVHPERYPLVEQMARDISVSLAELLGQAGAVGRIQWNRYVSGDVGMETLNDIKEELLKPGRDPRQEFRYAEFHEDLKEVKDLKPDMMLEGVVTNVTAFGAFVDIGVHQDGLVHKSELAWRFVQDPAEVIKVGDVVKVKVLKVDLDLNRISLSIKATQAAPKRENAPPPMAERRSDGGWRDQLKNWRPR